MKNLSKKILIILGLLILIIFFVPLFRGIFNIGNQFGMLVGISLILCGVFLPKIKKITKQLYTKKLGKVIVYTAFSGVIIFTLCFMITFSYVTINALNKEESNGTVIVLGCQVRGTVPSLQLHDRIVSAKDILNENEECAILSGGQGFGEDISEAQCMFERLTSMGISKNRLYLEDTSTSTETNLKNSLEIINENSLNSDICIVSSSYHIGRAKIMAKRVGFQNVTGYPAKTNIYAFPTYAAREVFAIWYLIIFG